MSRDLIHLPCDRELLARYGRGDPAAEHVLACVGRFFAGGVGVRTGQRWKRLKSKTVIELEPMVWTGERYVFGARPQRPDGAWGNSRTVGAHQLTFANTPTYQLVSDTPDVHSRAHLTVSAPDQDPDVILHWLLGLLPTRPLLYGRATGIDDTHGATVTAELLLPETRWDEVREALGNAFLNLAPAPR